MKRRIKALGSILTSIRMAWIRLLLLKKFDHQTNHPWSAQKALLTNILKINSQTEFGKRYDFANLTSYDHFKRQVPVHTYTELEPYIDRQIQSNLQCLTTEKPVIYAQTSGTTGRAKYIPILPKTIASYKKAQKIFSFIQYRDVPGIFTGKVLAIVSPAIEGYLPNGIPYGSMSGIVYENMPAIVLSKYVVPPAIFAVTDHNTKYLLIAAFALAEEDITALASANPSTFLRLSGVLHDHARKLTAFFATGDVASLGVKLDPKQALLLAKFAKPLPQRAEALRRIFNAQGTLRFSDVWPNVKAVVTWTSGNCALLLPKLRLQLLPTTPIIEMGYLSSEFHGTITIDCKKNLGIPTIEDVFFEFVETSEWDNNIENFLTIEQLQEGKRYYIIATTPHGLYRYFINDIIEVTGRYHHTPTITFVQKGKGVTNLTGEKLYESQVIDAVKQTCSTSRVDADFFIMLADEGEMTYQIYIESKAQFSTEQFSSLLDRALGELNIEYLAKAKSGRLKPVIVKRLKPGTFEAFKAHCLNEGQREGQFKVVRLQYRNDVVFAFEEYVL